MVNIKIPNWAKNSISKEGAKAVEKAVIELEKSTSAEIVPMVVHRSSTVGHIPIVMTLLLYTAFQLALSQFGYSEVISSTLYIAAVVLIVIISVFISRLSCIQRVLVNKGDQDAQVEQRAMVEFYQSSFHKTDGDTGILLFISLVERKAYVLADEAISQKLPPETWNAVLNKLITPLKSKDLSKGFVDAIKECEKILPEHFPIQNGDTNELSDHLIFKD